MFLICYRCVNKALNTGFKAYQARYDRISLSISHKKAGHVNCPALYCCMPAFYTCFSSCLLPVYCDGRVLYSSLKYLVKYFGLLKPTL